MATLFNPRPGGERDAGRATAPGVVTAVKTEISEPKFRWPSLQREIRRGATVIGYLNPHPEEELGLRMVSVRIGGVTIGKGLGSSVEGALACADESVEGYGNGHGLIVHQADSGISETAFDGFLNSQGSFSAEKADRCDIKCNDVILTLTSYDLDSGSMVPVGEPIRAGSLEEAFIKAFGDRKV